ncbi:MAG: hypothetical protein CVV27_03850 [Candidatus Melainabacteria bacterium HGW-Melainabacteria-1]|nr:MAG: hypothetical protein CVV27_03850 [Candidatus Melainabacteria bacterium HGW-Melainabacteria-1]
MGLRDDIHDSPEYSRREFEAREQRLAAMTAAEREAYLQKEQAKAEQVLAAAGFKLPEQYR